MLLLIIALSGLSLILRVDAACVLNPSNTFYPGSSTYASLAPLFNNAFVSSPAFVYAATSAADVADALCYANAQSFLVRVRAGGHSFTGESACPTPVACFQLDLTRMKSVSYNASTGIATVGPGALSADIYQALDPLGRSVVSGTCLPVGFSGLALGGGVGVLTRQFGLAMDRVVGYQVRKGPLHRTLGMMDHSLDHPFNRSCLQTRRLFLPAQL